MTAPKKRKPSLLDILVGQAERQILNDVHSENKTQLRSEIRKTMRYFFAAVRAAFKGEP